jgi:hypothetical protein
MTGKISKVEVETSFTLNRRELEILNHLTSYSNKDWVKGMVSSHYNGGVSEEDMVKFLDGLRDITSNLMDAANKAKMFN